MEWQFNRKYVVSIAAEAVDMSFDKLEEVCSHAASFVLGVSSNKGKREREGGMLCSLTCEEMVGSFTVAIDLDYSLQLN